MTTETEELPAPQRRPARDLSGKQRRHLRGLAHHVDPVVQVGKEGISSGTASALRAALERHELVKVRVLESAPVARDEAAEPLARAAGAHVIATIGRMVVLYRMRSEEPRIELPRP